MGKKLKMKMSRDWLISMIENDTLPSGMTYKDIVHGASSKHEAILFLQTQPELI